MTRAHSCDIFISGGGAAGLVASITLAARGLRVVCCTGETVRTPPGCEDNRVTALLPPTVAHLDSLGLWTALAAHAIPLKGACIVESGGAETMQPPRVDFTAGEFDRRDFGQIVQHRTLLAHLRGHVHGLANVTVLGGDRTCDLVTRTGSAVVRLASGARYEARLVIGADGRNSAIRALCNIGSAVHTPDQSALTFNVTHPMSHGARTWEIHSREGPLTLIPLPGHPDFTASSVVWMAAGRSVRTLRQLDDTALAAEATARSAGVLGELTLASAVTSWPIIIQTARQVRAERVVLIAEAAHVVPPIGAQGFNASITDIATLAGCLDRGGDPGAAETLDVYAGQRSVPAALRLQGVALLNHLSIARSPVTLALRRGLHSAARQSRPLQHLLVTVMEGR